MEAPTAGSVILASILLKMGTYGFLRFSLPLLPDSAKNPTVVDRDGGALHLGIVYGALASLMQKDWKKLVAYSSVSHLGFCTLGHFRAQPGWDRRLHPAADQSRHLHRHALPDLWESSYERRHTREITEYGGLQKVMPVFTMVFLIAALSSMGMPPLNGFIGGITILQGAYQMSLPGRSGAWWASPSARLTCYGCFSAPCWARFRRRNAPCGPSWREMRGIRPARRVGLLDRLLTHSPTSGCSSAPWPRSWSACAPATTPSTSCPIAGGNLYDFLAVTLAVSSRSSAALRFEIIHDGAQFRLRVVLTEPGHGLLQGVKGRQARGPPVEQGLDDHAPAVPAVPRAPREAFSSPACPPGR